MCSQREEPLAHPAQPRAPRAPRPAPARTTCGRRGPFRADRGQGSKCPHVTRSQRPNAPRQNSAPREPLDSLTPKELRRTNLPSHRPRGARSPPPGSPRIAARAGTCTLRTPQMPACSPGGPALKPPSCHSGQETGESGATLPGAASKVRVAVAANCVLRQGYGVSRAVTSGTPERSWAAAGLLPSARSPRPGSGPAERGGSRARSRPPGGGAREIRFALPTRPLSGAKARGWVLDLALEAPTASGTLMDTCSLPVPLGPENTPLRAGRMRRERCRRRGGGKDWRASGRGPGRISALVPGGLPPSFLPGPVRRALGRQGRAP